MNKRSVKNIEWSILVCTIILIIIGLISLYSATINSDLYEFKKQCMFIVISVPILILAIVIDYEIIARFSKYLYILSIILLIAVLFTGSVNGARSWFNIGFFAFQPAELAKVFVIIFLSCTIVDIQKQSKENINRFIEVLKVIGLAIIPIVLIAIQPDYGSAFAYVIALVLMLYVAGIDKKYIIISFIILLITIPLMYLFILPAHAKSRIDVFLNPNLDPRGAGYDIIQSKIAIGAGKLFGMGLFKGTQTHLGFLYPKTTDFIYSMIGEESGFIACSLIIVIYVILITKSISVAKTARDDLGSYIAIGFVRSFIIPCFRKYWNDNRASSYNRNTTTIFKLWWYIINNRFYNDRAIIKY